MKTKTKIAVGIGLFVLILTLSIVMNSKQVSAYEPGIWMQQCFSKALVGFGRCLGTCTDDPGCVSRCYVTFTYLLNVCMEYGGWVPSQSTPMYC